MNLREIQEKREADFLSPYATKSAQSKGRLKDEKKCTVRTDFQRDCDRIIHSKAFRRLMHKTQVFLNPVDDNYRTRLTHTLEVSAIGRAIARGLMLNENLEEAIALGHDLGHTPFGHAGESLLNEISSEGFSHCKQSLRVVDVLENGKGLNLTWEVRDGILNHSGKDVASTPEGKIIKFADRIAYINHDIDDAIREGLLSEKDLPEEYVSVLGRSKSRRINNMVQNIIENSMNSAEIKMSEEFFNAMMGMRTFLFERVYNAKTVRAETEKAKKILSALYDYYSENKDKMPKQFVAMLETNSTERVVCDFIAGMTDRFAINLFDSLFVPKSEFRGVY